MDYLLVMSFNGIVEEDRLHQIGQVVVIHITLEEVHLPRISQVMAIHTSITAGLGRTHQVAADQTFVTKPVDLEAVRP